MYFLQPVLAYHFIPVTLNGSTQSVLSYIIAYMFFGAGSVLLILGYLMYIPSLGKSVDLSKIYWVKEWSIDTDIRGFSSRVWQMADEICVDIYTGGGTGTRYWRKWDTGNVKKEERKTRHPINFVLNILNHKIFFSNSTLPVGGAKVFREAHYFYSQQSLSCTCCHLAWRTNRVASRMLIRTSHAGLVRWNFLPSLCLVLRREMEGMEVGKTFRRFQGRVGVATAPVRRWGVRACFSLHCQVHFSWAMRATFLCFSTVWI